MNFETSIQQKKKKERKRLKYKELCFSDTLSDKFMVAVYYLTPFRVILFLPHFCFVGLTSWIRKLKKNYMKEDSNR